MADAVVQFDNVSKRFRLGETHHSLADLLASLAGRCGYALTGHAGTRRSVREEFWALRNLSFTVERGRATGIIGPNGAGKSTALKLLAGILRADGGTISVRGRLAALIEVGAGFHSDLTGRENIFLNGAILGMSRAEVRRKLDDIVNFAGIEKFIDTPVKRYSSGMYARLGFSIAAHVKPDILLVDEVLSVGDAVFRLRCMDRMHELLRQGATLVFVTHNLEQMQSICESAVVLEAGQTAFSGPSREAVGYYMDAMSRSYLHRGTDLAGDSEQATEEVVSVEALRFLDEQQAEVVWRRSGGAVTAEVGLLVRQPIDRAVVELNMRASVNDHLLSLNSGRQDRTFSFQPGLHRVQVYLPRLPLRGGQYFWNVRVWDRDKGTTLLDSPFAYPLVLDDGGRPTGLVYVENDWTHEVIDGHVPDFPGRAVSDGVAQRSSGGPGSTPSGDRNRSGQDDQKCADAPQLSEAAS